MNLVKSLIKLILEMYHFFSLDKPIDNIKTLTVFWLEGFIDAEDFYDFNIDNSSKPTHLNASAVWY